MFLARVINTAGGANRRRFVQKRAFDDHRPLIGCVAFAKLRSSADRKVQVYSRRSRLTRRQNKMAPRGEFERRRCFCQTSDRPDDTTRVVVRCL